MTTMNMEELVRLVEKAVKEDENENEERALEILTQLESTPIDSLDFTSPKFAACGKSINTLRKKAKSEDEHACAHAAKPPKKQRANTSTQAQTDQNITRHK